jgi:hypothetical protein
MTKIECKICRGLDPTCPELNMIPIDNVVSVSTSRHGFMPKLPNETARELSALDLPLTFWIVVALAIVLMVIAYCQDRIITIHRQRLERLERDLARTQQDAQSALRHASEIDDKLHRSSMPFQSMMQNQFEVKPIIKP